MRVASYFLIATCSTVTASSWVANFEHAGAWVGSSLESSPLWYRGRLYLMQSQMGNFAPDGKPHGFFCLFDGSTGDTVACPPSSSGHAFCSALVDSTPGRSETMVGDGVSIIMVLVFPPPPPPSSLSPVGFLLGVGPRKQRLPDTRLGVRSVCKPCGGMLRRFLEFK
jgi:hypothetical protein